MRPITMDNPPTHQADAEVLRQTAEEAARGFKTEIPGTVDEENHPKCRIMNSE